MRSRPRRSRSWWHRRSEAGRSKAARADRRGRLDPADDRPCDYRGRGRLRQLSRSRLRAAARVRAGDQVDRQSVVPRAAVAYPAVSRDRKTYTFTIRSGLRFASGAPLSARNYVYAINRSMNPRMHTTDAAALVAAGTPWNEIAGARAVLQGKARTVSGIRARGRELVVTLDHPDASFPVSFATYPEFLCPVPAETFSFHPLGTSFSCFDVSATPRSSRLPRTSSCSRRHRSATPTGRSASLPIRSSPTASSPHPTAPSGSPIPSQQPPP